MGKKLGFVCAEKKILRGGGGWREEAVCGGNGRREGVGGLGSGDGANCAGFWLRDHVSIGSVLREVAKGGLDCGCWSEINLVSADG